MHVTPVPSQWDGKVWKSPCGKVNAKTGDFWKRHYHIFVPLDSDVLGESDLSGEVSELQPADRSIDDDWKYATEKHI